MALDLLLGVQEKMVHHHADGTEARQTVNQTQICHHGRNTGSQLHLNRPVIDSLGNRAFYAHRQRMVLVPCLLVVSNAVPLTAYFGTKPE